MPLAIVNKYFTCNIVDIRILVGNPINPRPYIYKDPVFDIEAPANFSLCREFEGIIKVGLCPVTLIATSNDTSGGGGVSRNTNPTFKRPIFHQHINGVFVRLERDCGFLQESVAVDLQVTRSVSDISAQQLGTHHLENFKISPRDTPDTRIQQLSSKAIRAKRQIASTC